ncbi:MAG: Ldh family oxidoreductase [Bacteroidetes bacterium]|nr:Ldh family oxidoreductase [Bacteroidota bacterium]MDA1120374.1 Ldh family oxidoreductase [Bacteroidota bacterium]
MSKLYNHTQLSEFGTKMLVKAGLPDDRARIVSETLLEADLMGHTTHGLALLPLYAKEVINGMMPAIGMPETIKDSGATITWDGKYLPGPWLTHHAIDIAFERIKKHPVITISIGQSHHIGCLAAYPERATKKGLMMLLSSSDPRNATVAPFGGLSGVYSPNPLAAGIPTKGDPIILDVSMSTTANGLVNRSHQLGEKLPHPWLQDNKGSITDDPAAFVEEPPATILPLGGLDTGYKGFALGILMEALTSGLAGNGRYDKPTSWGASVFLQVIDPEAFGGLAHLINQTQHLVDACLASEPKDVNNPVRIPGNRALQLRDKQKVGGVELHPAIMPALEQCAKDLGVEMTNW